MRWGLGFFRLWVVLTIGWVLFVSAFLASDFPKETQPWRHVYTESGADAGTITEVEQMVQRARAADDSEAVATFTRQLDLAKDRLGSRLIEFRARIGLLRRVLWPRGRRWGTCRIWSQPAANL